MLPVELDARSRSSWPGREQSWCCSARRADRLQEVAAEIESLGRRVAVVPGDVTDPAVRQLALQTAADRLGGLDILVNNAGIAALGRLETARPERLRQIFEVNVFALIELTRAALPLLKQGRQPIVANVGSILGHLGIANMTEYCEAKFAVRGFSEALRAELHPEGIDVLVVSPATVETEIWERMIEETQQTAWRARRGATPAYVARQAVRGIRRGRREVVPGWLTRATILANRLWPDVVGWLTARRH